MRRRSFAFGALALAIIALGTIISSGNAGGAEGEVSIMYPATDVFVIQPRIEVVGLAKGNTVAEVKVGVKGGKVDGANVVPVTKGSFSFFVNLRDGLNQISVADAATDLVQSKISVYLQTEKNKKKTPEGFSEYYLHSKEVEEHECDKCHNLRGAVPSYRRMRRSSTCMTDECHSDMGTSEFVHGPVAGGTCVACHNPHGSTNKDHRSRTGARECYVCHENKKDDFAKSNPHKPVAQGKCIDCHDPHQSGAKFQLKAKSVRDLCFNCHDTSLVKDKYMHGPVAAGGCVVCHDPHASGLPRLLVKESPELCFMCHEESRKRFERKNTHKPVAESCLNCHRPHGAEDPMLLKMQQNELCLSCHEKLHPEVSEIIRTAEVPHPPVAEGRCVACHTPHSTNFEKQLKANLKSICYNCHIEIGEKVRAAAYPHGPVEKSDCYACHSPHGSNNPKILNKFFPEEFYMPYDTEAYALCFDCHNKKIALDKVTTTLTNFRNGNLNLHYIHVNKDPKGRSCKSCHEVHAGDQEKHIREEVPFGSMWSYPINYTKLATGGKCVVGCHKPKEYDRENAVQQ
jgi:predicted CXXCH cytochrome family protein